MRPAGGSLFSSVALVHQPPDRGSPFRLLEGISLGMTPLGASSRGLSGPLTRRFWCEGRRVACWFHLRVGVGAQAARAERSDYKSSPTPKSENRRQGRKAAGQTIRVVWPVPHAKGAACLPERGAASVAVSWLLRGRSFRTSGVANSPAAGAPHHRIRAHAGFGTCPMCGCFSAQYAASAVASTRSS